MLAALFLLMPLSAEAAIVQGANAGTDQSAINVGQGYGGVCFTVDVPLDIRSVSVGLENSGNSLAASMFNLFNADDSTVVWQFGSGDSRTNHGTYLSIATTTSFHLYPAEYCLGSGANNGSEFVVGSASDGGIYSNAVGFTLTQLVNETRPSNITGFGSANYSLCDAFEVCPITTVTPSGPVYNTHITWLNPAVASPATSTASTSINFRFEYYINSSQTDASVLTNLLVLNCPQSYTVDANCDHFVSTSTLQVDTLATMEVFGVARRQGFTVGVASLWNGVEEVRTCSWYEFWCTPESPIQVAVTANRYNVASTTIPADIPLLTQEALEGGIGAASCGQIGPTTIFDFDNYATSTGWAMLCLGSIVSRLTIPDASSTAATLMQFKQGVLYKAPWGYATLAYDSLAGNAPTSTLPTLTFTYEEELNLPISGTVVDFSPWAGLEAAVTKLHTPVAGSPDSDFLDDMLYYWNFLCYLAFGAWILREVWGWTEYHETPSQRDHKANNDWTKDHRYKSTPNRRF